MNLGYAVIIILGIVLVVQIVKLVKTIINKKKQHKNDVKEFVENETKEEDK